MRAVPDIAVSFIKDKEKCLLIPYKDTGGIYTVGFGHVGPEVKPGQGITNRQAELYLKDDLSTACRRLNGAVKPDVIAELTDHQYAALISFVFNVGCQVHWSLWKTLNARKFDLVPGELMRFVYAGKVKVQGLVNRRAAEVALWSTGEPGSVPDEPASGVTRIVPTPPLAMPVQLQPAHLIGVSVIGLGGIAEGAKSVSNIVQPFADKSDIVQHLLSMAATVGAVAAVGLAGLMWLQHHQAKS